MSKQATLYPLGSLKDFLADDYSLESPLRVPFTGNPSIKDLIESQGIPHTAVFKIAVNNKESSFDCNINNSDAVTAYPFEQVEKNEVDKSQIQPTAFILDVHLGKLAKTLRLLGFNTIYNKELDDLDIIRLSNEQQRMILTRDIGLLRHGNTKTGYWVRNTDPDRQIDELFERFELDEHVNPFSRCMKCNGQLSNASLDEVHSKVPPKVQQWHSTFYQCHNCKQVYWKGSHFKELQKKVDYLLEK